LAGLAAVAAALALLVGGHSGESPPVGQPLDTRPPETRQTPQTQTPEERWRATLADLDSARAEAFEKGDEALLGRVYAPGSSALAQDTEALRSIVARGAHRTGGDPVVEALEVREEGTERVVLRLTERRLPASYVAEDGTVLATNGPVPPHTLDVILVNTADGWRIAESDRVTD
jgi:hypothetical protein